jgi:hypothetical protein
MPAERETAPGRHSVVPGAPVEREVRLDGPLSSAEAIRERVDGGFYHTPAVADVVARRILTQGDLGTP